MVLIPLLKDGQKIIDSATGNPYVIEGDRAILVKNGKTFKIALYAGHEDIDGFETGTYEIVSRNPKTIKTEETKPTKPTKPTKHTKK